MSNKFYVNEGTWAKVFCDIRCYDDIDNIWKLVKQDSNASDFQARFGHCLGIFYNFLITWDGCGPYLKKDEDQSVLWRNSSIRPKYKQIRETRRSSKLITIRSRQHN